MPETTLELSLRESGLDQLFEHNNFIGLHTTFGEYSEENQQNIRNSYRSKSHEILKYVTKQESTRTHRGKSVTYLIAEYHRGRLQSTSLGKLCTDASA